MFEKHSGLTDAAPEVIVQNLEGGGSVAITREAFESIGGMDESFIGWGGAHNEFWERAQTCRAWPYGYLPIVHLWHPSQPLKQRSENAPLRHSRQLSLIPAAVRIALFRAIDPGLRNGPEGYAVHETQVTNNSSFHTQEDAPSRSVGRQS